MNASKSCSKKMQRSVIGGSFLYLMLLVATLMACSSVTPASGCAIDVGQVIIISPPVPSKTTTNGQLADDMRDLVNQVEVDNTRKEGLRRQLQACSEVTSRAPQVDRTDFSGLGLANQEQAPKARSG